MRTIKFRGKDVETGKWMCSSESLVQTKEGIFMGDYNEERKIIPDTLGQFTGLLDKNDKEIYEGDILGKEGSHNCVVEWNNTLAHFQGTWANMPITACDIHTIVQYDYKVLGNIYDNPDLLDNTKEK